jgi:hypothetical protein
MATGCRYKEGTGNCEKIRMAFGVCSISNFIQPKPCTTANLKLKKPRSLIFSSNFSEKSVRHIQENTVYSISIYSG